MAFVPSDLSSIIAHWRGEDIPSGGADPLNWDDVVSAWRLTASSTVRPTYDATAIGGLPGLSFDGSNDRLITTTAKAISGPIGMSVVCRRTVSEYKGLCALNTSSTDSANDNGNQMAIYAWPIVNGVGVYYYDGTNSKYESWYPGMAINTDTVMTCVRGFGKGAGNLNGVRGLPAGSSATAPTEQSLTSYFHLGKFNTLFWPGKVAEVVIWNEPHDANHRYWVDGYLAHKYGITLPTWHPFYASAPVSGPSAGGASMRAVNIRGGADQ